MCSTISAAREDGTGPVASAFTVAGSFDYYTSGCYNYDSTAAVNHGMLIVGYDDALCSNNGAWIVKNSWGAGWGEAGYCYVAYGACNIGSGVTVNVSKCLRSRIQ